MQFKLINRIIIIKLRRIYTCLLQETNLKNCDFLSIMDGPLVGSGRVGSRFAWVGSQNLDPRATLCNSIPIINRDEKLNDWG